MQRRYSNRPYRDFGREREWYYRDDARSGRRSSIGPDFSDYREDEGYFGGSEPGFGQGISSGSSGGYEPSWRSATFSDAYDRPRFRNTAQRRASYRGQRVDDYYGGPEQYHPRYSSYGYPTSARGDIPYREEFEDRGWWDRASDEVASWFGDEDAERRREMDYRMDESHRGRGPRNYKRSDDRIRDDVNDRLTDSPWVDASDIEVEVSGGEVTLSGTVTTRYQKRMAEDVAEDISGVSNVENRLRVKASSSFQDGRADHLPGKHDTANVKSRTASAA